MVATMSQYRKDFEEALKEKEEIIQDLKQKMTSNAEKVEKY